MQEVVVNGLSKHMAMLDFYSDANVIGIFEEERRKKEVLDKVISLLKEVKQETFVKLLGSNLLLSLATVSDELHKKDVVNSVDKEIVANLLDKKLNSKFHLFLRSENNLDNSDKSNYMTVLDCLEKDNKYSYDEKEGTLLRYLKSMGHLSIDQVGESQLAKQVKKQAGTIPDEGIDNGYETDEHYVSMYENSNKDDRLTPCIFRGHASRNQAESLAQYIKLCHQPLKFEDIVFGLYHIYPYEDPYDEIFPDLYDWAKSYKGDKVEKKCIRYLLTETLRMSCPSDSEQ